MCDYTCQQELFPLTSQHTITRWSQVGKNQYKALEQELLDTEAVLIEESQRVEELEKIAADGLASKKLTLDLAKEITWLYDSKHSVLVVRSYLQHLIKIHNLRELIDDQ